MMNSSMKNQIRQLLEKAGIRINGEHPWDIQVHNEQFYPRVIRQGPLGLGEAYMDGWWDAEQLDAFFCRVLRANLDEMISSSFQSLWNYVKAVVSNPQSENKAYEVGRQHYDAGNDLYDIMLDPRMVYTCGYWKQGDSLADAQENKLNTVCQILDLQPGQRLLDIGCGWGSFVQFAAEKYGVDVVGITVSKNQKELADRRCGNLPVEIRLQDYRALDEEFDHIVSLGMFEHVGYKNYRTYMQVVDRCLADDGIFVLHTIGGNKSVWQTDPWIEKYIFPNSMIPSIRQIGLAIEGLFVMENWSNQGPHYDKTLMAWYQNFTDGWEQIKENYSERFRRMWTYYLLSCAGSFRARKNQQWQVVLTKKRTKWRVSIPGF